MKRTKRFIVALAVISIGIALSGRAWAEETGKKADPKAEQQAEKININTATVEELTQLKRIGPKYAQRIIQYREKNGPFEKVEDLINVTGIGQKTFEDNKDAITVGPKQDKGVSITPKSM